MNIRYISAKKGGANMNKRSLAFLIAVFFIFSGFNSAWGQDNRPVQTEQISSKDGVGIDVSRLSYLLPAEQEKLKTNGFVIFVPFYSSGCSDDALSVYSKCKISHFPVFITSDIVLHASHLFYDWALRFLEIGSLRQDLLNLTDAMLSQSLAYYDQCDQKELKEAAFKNALFFNVAKTLLAGGNLNELPDDVRKIIEAEVTLINEHKGFAVSPLFGYEEDYSQYVPRGHYARSPEFEKYFKAMMWYGRQSFRLPDATLQTILLCKAINETKIKGETALAVWERIYETTGFFAGKADDLSVKQYLNVMNEVYGDNPPIGGLSNKSKITEFVKKAGQLPKPRILSTKISDVETLNTDWPAQHQGLRFMGQRFTPDAHIFQNLVYGNVKKYKGAGPEPFTAVRGIRGFPRGLDVMAVFGSKAAEQILIDEKDSDFEGYKEQFVKLQSEYDSQGTDAWTSDLYARRLWTLKSILGNPQGNVPFFMKSDAWLKKQLNTALGAWTELKHDTILYSEQSYSCAQMSMAGKDGWERELPAEVVRGYVEPVPEFYARARASIEQLRLNLTSLGFPKDNALTDNLQWYGNFLASLEAISKKELAGSSLSYEEYALIDNAGDTLFGFLKFPHYRDLTEEFRDKMDNTMPLVADVFTDTNSGQVLEEAIGHPAEIFVIAPVDGKNKVCMGVVYSHYEFKQPMNDRLTDEKWRGIIQENKLPDPEKWLNDIAVIKKANGR
jgi:hypothetical protein